MYAGLRLGEYSPYICMYTNIEACAQRRADIYIYIYIYMLESWKVRLNLACAAQYGYRKLWYMTLSFYIYIKTMYMYS